MAITATVNKRMVAGDYLDVLAKADSVTYITLESASMSVEKTIY